MRILPVLDLMNGVVVRGIAGQREAYRPIQSRLTRATDPLGIARAFRDHFGLTTLYLADLDAIAGASPSFAAYDALAADGFSLWVDAGLRDAAIAPRLLEQGVESVIAGLETIPGPEFFQGLTSIRDRIVVSLDMKAGQPLTPFAPWRSLPIEEIALQIARLGFRRFLFLDLARVGIGQGTGTEEHCQRLIQSLEGRLELMTGGGVRDREDLLRLKDLGLAGVLLASALHDGAITQADLDWLSLV